MAAKYFDMVKCLSLEKETKNWKKVSYPTGLPVRNKVCASLLSQLSTPKRRVIKAPSVIAKSRIDAWKINGADAQICRARTPLKIPFRVFFFFVAKAAKATTWRNESPFGWRMPLKSSYRFSKNKELLSLEQLPGINACSERWTVTSACLRLIYVSALLPFDYLSRNAKKKHTKEQQKNKFMHTHTHKPTHVGSSRLC